MSSTCDQVRTTYQTALETAEYGVQLSIQEAEAIQRIYQANGVPPEYCLASVKTESDRYYLYERNSIGERHLRHADVLAVMRKHAMQASPSVEWSAAQIQDLEIQKPIFNEDHYPLDLAFLRQDVPRTGQNGFHLLTLVGIIDRKAVQIYLWAKRGNPFESPPYRVQSYVDGRYVNLSPATLKTIQTTIKEYPDPKVVIILSKDLINESEYPLSETLDTLWQSVLAFAANPDAPEGAIPAQQPKAYERALQIYVDHPLPDYRRILDEIAASMGKDAATVARDLGEVRYHHLLRMQAQWPTPERAQTLDILKRELGKTDAQLETDLQAACRQLYQDTLIRYFGQATYSTLDDDGYKRSALLKMANCFGKIPAAVDEDIATMKASQAAPQPAPQPTPQPTK